MFYVLLSAFVALIKPAAVYQATFAKSALKGYYFDEKKSEDSLYITIQEGDSKRSRDDDSDDDSRKRLRIT